MKIKRSSKLSTTWNPNCCFSLWAEAARQLFSVCITHSICQQAREWRSTHCRERPMNCFCPVLLELQRCIFLIGFFHDAITPASVKLVYLSIAAPLIISPREHMQNNMITSVVVTREYLWLFQSSLNSLLRWKILSTQTSSHWEHEVKQVGRRHCWWWLNKSISLPSV